MPPPNSVLASAPPTPTAKVANTQFTSVPGFLAQAPTQNAAAVATAQNGQAVRTYVAQSNHGTWLFPPYQGNG